MLSFTSAIVATSLLVVPAAHGWQVTDQRSHTDRTPHSRPWTGDRSAATPVTPATPAPATSTTPAAELSPEVRAVLDGHNRHRAARGHPALTYSASVSAVAQQWSQDMTSSGSFRHNPAYADRMPVGWTRVAENIAMNSTTGTAGAEHAVRQWIASAGHERNMTGDYTHIGVGVATGARGTYYTVNFGKYATSPDGAARTSAPSPTRGTAPAPTLSAPAPTTTPVATTGGTGGTYTDRTGRTFTGAGRTSQYHVWAGHVDPKRPVKLMVHLHGDGAHEFNSPTSSVVRDYLAIAKERNAVLVVPRTPNADRTWWRDRTASDWLAALIRDVYAQYPVDRSDVWFSAFSGGSQALTQHFLPKHHGLVDGGGAVVVGGGTASTSLAAAGADLGSDFEVHYVVGSADRGSVDGFDAYTAATRGATLFRAAGFREVTLTVIPGAGHRASANDGSRVMSAHIDR